MREIEQHIDHLQSDEQWRAFTDLVTPKVQEKLGDRGFLVTVTLMEKERAGEITRSGVRDIYNIILQGDSSPFHTVWKHDWYMDHDQEAPTY
jgi:hypothetical protein